MLVVTKRVSCRPYVVLLVVCARYAGKLGLCNTLWPSPASDGTPLPRTFMRAHSFVLATSQSASAPYIS